MGWIKTRISLLKNENGNNNIKISIHKTLPILGCVSGIQAKTPCFACNSTQLALNLPSMISFGDNSFIKYTYSATGEKLGVEYGVRLQPVLSPTGQDATMSENGDADGTMRDRSGGFDPGTLVPIAMDGITYCGNVVYDGNDARLLTDEGYVTFTATGTPQYHYYLRDHLGNIRVVMGQTGALEQVNHYYAFGGLMRESTNPGVQPYKFGGKELDRTSGLDAYDFGARMYFADRMQWGTMDPMCEKYYDVSPYEYCHDNPINRIGPNGEDDYWLTNMGYIVWGAQTNRPYHTIYANNGSSINVSKSFIDSQQNYVASGMSSNARDNKISTYNITTYTAENGEGKGIFEFFANNTKVEWSNVTLSSPKGSVEFIGTSNSEGDDLSMSIIIEEASADQTVTQATHSHDFDNGLPSPADLKIAHQINSRYPNASLYIYDRLGYNKYNEFSSTEPNVVVTPSKVFYDDEKTKK